MRILSLGRLVEDEGFDLVWKRGSCMLRDPAGDSLNVRVEDYVPILEPPSACPSTAPAAGQAASASAPPAPVGEGTETLYRAFPVKPNSSQFAQLLDDSWDASLLDFWCPVC